MPQTRKSTMRSPNKRTVAEADLGMDEPRSRDGHGRYLSADKRKRLKMQNTGKAAAQGDDVYEFAGHSTPTRRSQTKIGKKTGGDKFLEAGLRQFSKPTTNKTDGNRGDPRTAKKGAVSTTHEGSRSSSSDCSSPEEQEQQISLYSKVSTTEKKKAESAVESSEEDSAESEEEAAATKEAREVEEEEEEEEDEYKDEEAAGEGKGKGREKIKPQDDASNVQGDAEISDDECEEEETEYPLPASALLGLPDVWEETLKAVRSNCTLKKFRHMVTDDDEACQTHTMNTVCDSIRRAIDKLERLSESRNPAYRKENIDACINEIHDDSIRALRQDVLRPAVLNDIFRVVIPGLIYLLKSSICASSTSVDYGLLDVKGIIRIMDLVDSLSERARISKAKASWPGPITKPITGVAIPRLRRLRKRFFARQKDLEDEERETQYTAQQETTETSPSPEPQPRGPSLAAIAAMRQSLMDTFEKENGRPFTFMSGQKIAVATTTLLETPVGWNKDESKELIRLLQGEDTRHLAARERYYAIKFTSTLLRQKSMAEIRDRALSLKKHLIGTHKDKSCFESISFVEF